MYLDKKVALCYNIDMKYNEKKTPHYNINLIKELIRQRKYQIRKIALENAMCDFDLKHKDIISYVLNIENSYFYKSMTSEYDNKLWQDVYHVPIGKDIAYVKLQIVSDESVVIQFKRK